jgi:hypothetical protein
MKRGSHTLSIEQFKADKARQELNFPAQRKVDLWLELELGLERQG